jgi:hypothetical protein
MTLDVISGRGGLMIFIVALLVGAWVFLDAKGMLRLLFRLGAGPLGGPGRKRTGTRNPPPDGAGL